MIHCGVQVNFLASTYIGILNKGDNRDVRFPCLLCDLVITSLIDRNVRPPIPKIFSMMTCLSNIKYLQGAIIS